MNAVLSELSVYLYLHIVHKIIFIFHDMLTLKAKITMITK